MPSAFLILFTFAVLLAVFAGFVRERMAPHLVALTGMVVLLIAGAISTNDMLAVFSSSAPITIACMFVISAALDQTGVIDWIGRKLVSVSAYNKYLGIVGIILVVAFISAFMNNTPVVIILTPVIITIAQKLKDYPSRFLIPLSYAAILGGMCTMIGTSTNILVNDIAQKFGQAPFSMFEITFPGMMITAVGLSFVALAGRFLLPDRQPPRAQFTEGKSAKRFLAEAIITVDSPLIKRTLNEIKFTEAEGYEIIDLIRNEAGARMGVGKTMESFLQKLWRARNESEKRPASAFRDVPLEAGDRLVFKGDKDEIVELKKFIGIDFDLQKAHFGESLPAHEVIVAEGIIPPNSSFIGSRIKDLRLRRAYGCFVIGVHRQDENITGNLPNIVLEEGDSLILEGAEDDLDRLFERERILNVSFIRHKEVDRAKAPVAVLVVAGVVGFSTLGFMPIAGLAMIGAVAVILAGCVTPEQAYHTIDWRILLLIFGMLGIGTALENTGAASLLVTHIVGLVDNLGPVVILAAVYLTGSIMTEFVTNNAVAVILTPIVIALATSLGYDPRPFVVAVMFAASASFATPIGYQTNTFVYAAGGYKFKDFLKIGIPMNLLTWAVAVNVIPLFWPFVPAP